MPYILASDLLTRFGAEELVHRLLIAIPCVW